jgi:chromosome partitioning protein
MKDIERNFGDLLFQNVIPRTVALAESPSFGKTIFDYDPIGFGAIAFDNISQEFLEKINRIWLNSHWEKASRRLFLPLTMA